MKAIRLLEYGGQLVFDDVPTPPIARDEVLVKVTAVNHLDLVEASGSLKQVLPIGAVGVSARAMPILRRVVRYCPTKTDSKS